MPEATRERIVKAVANVLARKGYVQTSVKDVAADAGVAAGLVHYYFETKEQLMVAALEYVCTEMATPPEGVDAEAVARSALERVKQTRDQKYPYLRLYMEMLGLSMHDESLRRAFVPFLRADREQVEAGARAVLAQRGDRRVERAPAFAAAVWGAVLGIQIQALLEPEFDVDGATDALMELALEATR